VPVCPDKQSLLLVREESTLRIAQSEKTHMKTLKEAEYVKWHRQIFTDAFYSIGDGEEGKELL
jgi:hypothetical protein